MRHLVKTAALCTLTLVLVSAGNTAPRPGRAKLRLSPEMFDFGYIPQGLKVANRYWLANDGLDTLVVATVKPQCGCTTAPLTRDRVAPKDSVPLDVLFDSKNINGVVNKKVTVVSNSSTGDSISLYFTGRVDDKDSIVNLQPRVALFTEIDKLKEIIKLTNLSHGEFKVRLAAPPPGYFTCELSNTTLAAGGSLDVTLTRGKGTPVGQYETSITLLLDAPVPHPVSIPIKGLGYME